MTVANSCEADGRIAIWYRCMANLTVYLLKVSNSRRVDRHVRYPGNLSSACEVLCGCYVSCLVVLCVALSGLVCDVGWSYV